MGLWCSKRETLLKKGLPIETSRIEDWKEKSRVFSSPSIDWKNREIDPSPDDIEQPLESSKFRRVFKSSWVYKEGSPERRTSYARIPKDFGFAPERYSRGERDFYS